MYLHITFPLDNVVLFVALQGRVLAGAARGVENGSRQTVCRENHRQDGAQRQRGLARERDQSFTEVGLSRRRASPGSELVRYLARFVCIFSILYRRSTGESRRTEP